MHDPLHHKHIVAKYWKYYPLVSWDVYSVCPGSKACPFQLVYTRSQAKLILVIIV